MCVCGPKLNFDRYLQLINKLFQPLCCKLLSTRDVQLSLANNNSTPKQGQATLAQANKVSERQICKKMMLTLLNILTLTDVCDWLLAIQYFLHEKLGHYFAKAL